MYNWDEWQVLIEHGDMDSLDFAELIMQIEEDFDGVDNKLSDGAKKAIETIAKQYPMKRTELLQEISDLRRAEVEEVLKGVKSE